MSRMRKFALGLGVVAGLAMSILPLGAYADDDPDLMKAKDELLVRVNVAPVISMRLESHYNIGTETVVTETCNSVDIVAADPENNIEASDGCTGDDQEVWTILAPGQADTSSMYTNIYVSTNSLSGYTLTLIDADANTNLVSENNDTIATINSLPVGTTNPGWAIHIDGDTSEGTDVWRKMPKNKTETTPAEAAITVKNYTPATPAVTQNDMSKVTYGVAASSDQAAGTYHDVVVYTATAS